MCVENVLEADFIGIDVLIYNPSSVFVGGADRSYSLNNDKGEGRWCVCVCVMSMNSTVIILSSPIQRSDIISDHCRL